MNLFETRIIRYLNGESTIKGKPSIQQIAEYIVQNRAGALELHETPFLPVVYTDATHRNFISCEDIDLHDAIDGKTLCFENQYNEFKSVLSEEYHRAANAEQKNFIISEQITPAFDSLRIGKEQADIIRDLHKKQVLSKRQSRLVVVKAYCDLITSCYNLITEYYPELNRQETAKGKTPQHFTFDRTDEDKGRIYNGLIKGGYLSMNTPRSHFDYVFGGNVRPDDFKPLDWQCSCALLSRLIYKLFQKGNGSNLWKVSERCFRIKGKSINTNSLKNRNLQEEYGKNIRGSSELDEIIK